MNTVPRVVVGADGLPSGVRYRGGWRVFRLWLAAQGTRTRRALALPCSTSAMASFTSASGLVS
jgi:hypothetical protein